MQARIFSWLVTGNWTIWRFSLFIKVEELSEISVYKNFRQTFGNGDRSYNIPSAKNRSIRILYPKSFQPYVFDRHFLHTPFYIRACRHISHCSHPRETFIDILRVVANFIYMLTWSHVHISAFHLEIPSKRARCNALSACAARRRTSATGVSFAKRREPKIFVCC